MGQDLSVLGVVLTEVQESLCNAVSGLIFRMGVVPKEVPLCYNGDSNMDTVRQTRLVGSPPTYGPLCKIPG